MRPIKYLGKGWVFRLDEPYPVTCPPILSLASPSELFEHFFSKNDDDVEEFVDRLAFRLGALWLRQEAYGSFPEVTKNPENAKTLMATAFEAERDKVRDIVTSIVDRFDACDRVVFGGFLSNTDFFLEEIDNNV